MEGPRWDPEPETRPSFLLCMLLRACPAWFVCVLIFETWAEIAKSLLQFIGTGKYFSINYLMYIYYIDHALTV